MAEATTQPVGARVAVTCAGDTLDDPVDPRFGRCQYFMILALDGALEAVPNNARGLGNGAGIQAAQEMITRKVDAVLTGDVGPKAYTVLTAAGVDIYVGCGGTVREVIERHRNGDLAKAYSATASGRHRMCIGRRRNRP